MFPHCQDRPRLTLWGGPCLSVQIFDKKKTEKNYLRGPTWTLNWERVNHLLCCARDSVKQLQCLPLILILQCQRSVYSQIQSGLPLLALEAMLFFYFKGRMANGFFVACGKEVKGSNAFFTALFSLYAWNFGYCPFNLAKNKEVRSWLFRYSQHMRYIKKCNLISIFIMHFL